MKAASFLTKMMCVTGLTMLVLVASASAGEETASARDIELDFRFLRAGLTRKAVIAMLGSPVAQTVSQTFALTSHKLIWTGPDGQRFVAAFINNRLWHWKTCSVTIAHC